MVTQILLKMYPILNVHLCLALVSFDFLSIDNGGALVAESWAVSLLKNPIEPP